MESQKAMKIAEITELKKVDFRDVVVIPHTCCYGFCMIDNCPGNRDSYVAVYQPNFVYVK